MITFFAPAARCLAAPSRLVKIPVSELKPGVKVKGTTIAELGNRNTPLDMIMYKKDGKDYLLMINDKRGVMKIDLEKVGTIDGITARVGGKAGLPYEAVDTLKGVTVTAATAGQIQTSLKAIGDDLKKIAGAQGDLSDSRKQQVKDANAAFTSQVSSTVSDLGKSLSLTDARSQLESALRQLASAYQSSFAKVDC